MAVQCNFKRHDVFQRVARHGEEQRNHVRPKDCTASATACPRTSSGNSSEINSHAIGPKEIWYAAMYKNISPIMPTLRGVKPEPSPSKP